MKLVPLATAPDQLVAEMWQEMLAQEGIQGVISPSDAVSFLGVTSIPCRVLVPEDQVEAARAIIEAPVEALEELEP